MSYDQALEHLRQQPVEPPSFTDVERRRRWTEQRRVPSGRRRTALVATYVSVLAYVALSIRPIIDAVGLGGGTVAALWQGTGATLLPAGLLLWAARMARRSALGPQMLSRAILWSNLVVGVLIAAAFWSGMDRTLGVVIAFACATALIALGARGLHGREEDDGVFRPTRFRGLLLVALVMAFADAQTLLFSGIMQLRIGMDGWNLLGTLRYAGPTLVASGVMVVAVWGPVPTADVGTVAQPRGQLRHRLRRARWVLGAVVGGGGGAGQHGRGAGVCSLSDPGRGAR